MNDEVISARIDPEFAKRSLRLRPPVIGDGPRRRPGNAAPEQVGPEVQQVAAEIVGRADREEGSALGAAEGGEPEFGEAISPREATDQASVDSE